TIWLQFVDFRVLHRPGKSFPQQINSWIITEVRYNQGILVSYPIFFHEFYGHLPVEQDFFKVNPGLVSVSLTQLRAINAVQKYLDFPVVIRFDFQRIPIHYGYYSAKELTFFCSGLNEAARPYDQDQKISHLQVGFVFARPDCVQQKQKSDQIRRSGHTCRKGPNQPDHALERSSNGIPTIPKKSIYYNTDLPGTGPSHLQIPPHDANQSRPFLFPLSDNKNFLVVCKMMHSLAQG